MKNTGKRLLTLASVAAILVLSIYLFYAALIPETVSCFAGASAPEYIGTTFQYDRESDALDGGASVASGSYKLFGTIPVRRVTLARLEDVKVYVGGVPFGIKFSTKGAAIVGFEDEKDSAAFLAGLRVSDTIVSINGKEISGAADVLEAVSGGETVEIGYLRNGKRGSVMVKPGYRESEGRYSLGAYLKDSGAGIGTLTYVLEDGSFGGLGHGICDPDTGELLPMVNAQALGATISGVQRGERGTPGELKGYFSAPKLGSIYKNTECGVFGVLAAVPENIKDKLCSIGLRGDVTEGAATIICTTDKGTREEYSIEISGIDRSASGNKCFTVRITDPRLLERTGGIVQGMSGSPIMQNGKLIGAVTHVLINDPTRGYGIFVENMLVEMHDGGAAARNSAA